MGAVYKARDTELERLVALKLIRPDLAGNPEILRRFKQELILAREVTHRNVIRIFDLGQAKGFKFITMEFVEGRDLRAVLREKVKLPPDETVQDHRAGLPRTGICTRRRCRPPRSETSKHHAGRERPRLRDGLWHRAFPRNTGNDADGRIDGHAGIYVARAGQRHEGRCALGSVCSRHNFL